MAHNNYIVVSCESISILPENAESSITFLNTKVSTHVATPLSQASTSVPSPPTIKKVILKAISKEVGRLFTLKKKE